MEHQEAVSIFTYAGSSPVRVVMIAGEPWFCAADVCEVLAQTNSRRAVAILDADERITVNIRKAADQEGSVRNPYGIPAGNPNMTFVSESGLFTLILRSLKPEAKTFRRWVTHDVLPSIRRTGRYTPATPATCENMDALVARAIGSLTDLAARTGDLTKAVEINTLAVARLTTELSTDPPPTSETHSEEPVLHRDVHRVIHRPTSLPTPGDRRRLSAETVAECRRRARDGVSVYRLAREYAVSDSTMRAAVRGQTYRYVTEPPVRP